MNTEGATYLTLQPTPARAVEDADFGERSISEQASAVPVTPEAGAPRAAHATPS